MSSHSLIILFLFSLSALFSFHIQKSNKHYNNIQTITTVVTNFILKYHTYRNKDPKYGTLIYLSLFLSYKKIFLSKNKRLYKKKYSKTFQKPVRNHY